MAISQSMKRAVRRIADALGVYARRRGWWPLDFRLYFRVNEAWGKIHITFYAYEFEGQETFESYQSVMNYLRTRLDDDPELLSALGLVVRSFKNLDGRGLHAIESHSRLVRPRDLLKVAMREVAGLLDKYARDSGWEKNDYSILSRVEPEQDKLRIILVSPNPEDDRGVSDLLQSRLADDPEILKSFEFSHKVPEDLGPEGLHSLIKAGYKDFWMLARA
jgi:hypothetical protein